MSRRKAIVMGGSLKLSAVAILASIPELEAMDKALEAAGFKLSRDIVTGEITRSLKVRFTIAWKAGRRVVRREVFEIPLWAFSGRRAGRGGEA